jgi:hypothetical protein
MDTAGKEEDLIDIRRRELANIAKSPFKFGRKNPKWLGMDSNPMGQRLMIKTMYLKHSISFGGKFGKVNFITLPHFFPIFIVDLELSSTIWYSSEDSKYIALDEKLLTFCGSQKQNLKQPALKLLTFGIVSTHSDTSQL